MGKKGNNFSIFRDLFPLCLIFPRQQRMFPYLLDDPHHILHRQYFHLFSIRRANSHPLHYHWFFLMNDIIYRGGYTHQYFDLWDLFLHKNFDYTVGHHDLHHIGVVYRQDGGLAIADTNRFLFRLHG